MTASARILLVSCYELGHAPHGLALPRAFLERAGFEVDAVDLAVEGVDDARLAQARLVAVSVPMHTALRLGAAFAERVRAVNPEATLCFFGHYAPLNADFLRTLGADACLGGECEAALVDLARAALGDARNGGEGAPVTLAKLDFPRPSRAGVDLSRYAHLIDADGRHRQTGYTEATRGCLDTCRHCPVPAVYGGRFFVIPRDVVLDDIAQLVRAGAEHITFGDPDFLNGPGHTLAIVRELHRRWPHLSFDVTAQVSNLLRHAEVLPELVACGCAFAVTAVESISDTVLAALNKRHRRRDVLALLDVARDAGLPLRPTFVAFTPWTTLDDLRELCDLIARRGLEESVDPIQLSIRLLVPPGSLLLASDETATSFGDLDPEALGHRWRHPDPRMDALAGRIARRCEVDAAEGRAPTATFEAIRRDVYGTAGLRAPPPAPPRARKRIPRLTEPWFC